MSHNNRLDIKKVITITYKNWEGITSKRNIIPIELVFKESQWHAGEQWILRVFDVDKQAEREFAVLNILNFSGHQVIDREDNSKMDGREKHELPNIPYYILVCNAMYAKGVSQISYDDIYEFKKIIYRNIIADYYPYVMFNDINNETIFSKYGKDIYIKETNGVLLFNDLDEEFMNKINGIYPKELQSVIKKSRDMFKEEPKKLVNKK